MRKAGLPHSSMTMWMALLACAALVIAAERAGAQSSSSKSSTSSKSVPNTKAKTPAPDTKAKTPAPESTPSSSSKAWLGVYSQNVDPDLREALDLKGGGALVTRVVAGSPAERAGIKRRDYVVRFNGEAVDGADDLSRLVRNARVDQSVSVEVMRDGAKQTLNLKLGARPSDFDEDGDNSWGWNQHEVVVPDMDGESFHMHQHDLDDLKNDAHVFVQRISPRGRLGVRVEDMNSDLAPYFSMKDQKGALVVEVIKDSPAQKAGLKAGDVIVQVGEQQVSDTEDLVRALRDEEGDTKVSVLRKGARMTMTPKLDTPEPMGYQYRAAPHAVRIHGDAMTPDERERMQDEMRRMQDQLREMQQRLDKLEKD